MVDIPDRLDDHAPVFIYGVEGEQIEEENDAYNDMRYELGEDAWGWDLSVNNIFSGTSALSSGYWQCFFVFLFNTFSKDNSLI